MPGAILENHVLALFNDAMDVGEPFEAVVPLVTEPDPDVFKRLEDAGATATVSYPFTYTVGPTSDLDAKRAYLEGFANNVIVPLS